MAQNGHESSKDGKWSDPKLPLPDCQQLLNEELERVRRRKRPAADAADGAAKDERPGKADERPGKADERPR